MRKVHVSPTISLYQCMYEACHLPLTNHLQQLIKGHGLTYNNSVCSQRTAMSLRNLVSFVSRARQIVRLPSISIPADTPTLPKPAAAMATEQPFRTAIYQEVKAWIEKQEAFEAEHKQPAPLTDFESQALQVLRLAAQATTSAPANINFIGMLQGKGNRPLLFVLLFPSLPYALPLPKINNYFS